MFPEECENCGLKTDDLKEMPIPGRPPLNWFICTHCYGKLYQHEFYPRDDWKDMCVTCGKKFKHDIHC